jgi:hypothetical protein
MAQLYFFTNMYIKITQTGSKDIICFYSKPARCYTSQGWLPADVTTIICFADLVALHHILHLTEQQQACCFVYMSHSKI